jgi:hypothetical protein
MVVSATAPVSPVDGTQWFDTSDGSTYLYYKNGTNRQWVELMAQAGTPINTSAVNALTPQFAANNYSLNKTGSWGVKSAPSYFASAYLNRWNYGRHGGRGIDALTYDYGIYIQEDGYYEVRGAQRCGSTTNPYFGVTVGGNRTTLEGRTAGIWSHSHSNTLYTWTESYYIGPLYAGEIVTGGAPDSGTAASLMFGSGWAGYLSVERLR